MSAQRARVIVAAYNQVPALRRALRGYLRQTVRDFTLVVADDGSGPETAAVLEEFRTLCAERGLDLEHVWHEDRGFRKCHILNEAVRQGRGEPLLIFSDGDCIPPAHFVERHLAAHEARSLHVAGAFRLPREVSAAITEADVDAGRFEGLGTPENHRELRIKRRKSTWGTRLRRRNRPKMLGLNMAFDRDLLVAINGFDERFDKGVGLGEDSDVCDRAMRLRPRPRVKNLYLRNDVYHLWHPPSPGQRENNRAYYDTKRPARCEVGLTRP